MNYGWLDSLRREYLGNHTGVFSIDFKGENIHNYEKKVTSNQKKKKKDYKYLI